MAQAVEEWYKQMPIITRSYLITAIVTTIGCSLDVLLGFSVLVGASAWVDLLGVIAGHAYFLKMCIHE